MEVLVVVGVRLKEDGGKDRKKDGLVTLGFDQPSTQFTFVVQRRSHRGTRPMSHLLGLYELAIARIRANLDGPCNPVLVPDAESRLLRAEEVYAALGCPSPSAAMPESTPPPYTGISSPPPYTSYGSTDRDVEAARGSQEALQPETASATAEGERSRSVPMWVAWHRERRQTLAPVEQDKTVLLWAICCLSILALTLGLGLGLGYQRRA
ncbi:hypothetical protein K490DRAFT_52702 [Saccharata proteae CBS 121410]|uniref:Uncharacterized protein n=1 Tax=Saccharata proteae CBS 121410 TaxID=1314787 RepID=A0A9P4M1T0_9PEZI|nr:hypothetical protein K490DRAFT_52702 [Saccharata proteae CBS 121410]